MQLYGNSHNLNVGVELHAHACIHVCMLCSSRKRKKGYAHVTLCMEGSWEFSCFKCDVTHSKPLLWNAVTSYHHAYVGVLHQYVALLLRTC